MEGKRGETLKGLQRRNLPGPVNPDRKQHVSESLNKILEIMLSNFTSLNDPLIQLIIQKSFLTELLF